MSSEHRNTSLTMPQDSRMLMRALCRRCYTNRTTRARQTITHKIPRTGQETRGRRCRELATSAEGRRRVRVKLLSRVFWRLTHAPQIRCDAINETGQEPCTNCKRTGAICAFSRQPMKRGPSKGYIKELADRLHTLENQIQPHQVQPLQAEMQYIQQRLAEEGVHQGPNMQGYASPPAQAGRKRTHSVSENSHEQPSRPSYSNEYSGNTSRSTPFEPLPAPQNMQPPPRTPQPQSDGRPALPPPPPQLPPPSNVGLQPFFKYGGDTGRRESISIPYESDAIAGSSVVDWDEAVIDEYGGHLPLSH